MNVCGASFALYFVLLQFRVVGVELGTSAHNALKDGHIKLLDTITHMNEDEIQSKEWFDQFTRSKTRPLLTILRNHNSPSGIKALITKGTADVIFCTMIFSKINISVYS